MSEEEKLTAEEWHKKNGVDLFNHGYYWESHEEWESLWHAAGRRGVVADGNRVFAVAATELGYAGHCHIVQTPERVFVKRLDAFCQAYFNAVGQQVILPQEILFLDSRIKHRVIFFADGHGGGKNDPLQGLAT